MQPLQATMMVACLRDINLSAFAEQSKMMMVPAYAKDRAAEAASIAVAQLNLSRALARSRAAMNEVEVLPDD